ncbi:gamma-interferon-inducible lysosomal thiol reductase, partial [Coturnix japonica]
MARIGGPSGMVWRHPRPHMSQRRRCHMRRTVAPGRKGVRRRVQQGFKSPSWDRLVCSGSRPPCCPVPMAPAVLLALLAVGLGLGLALPGCDYPTHLWCSSREITTVCQAENYCANLSHPTAAPVQVSLYYESMCQGCRIFLTHQLFSTWLLLPDGVLNITLVPYGNAQEKNVSGKWQFQCQHGSEECLGNMLQACLMHEAQDFNTYFPIIFCMESGSSATKNLEACLQVYAPKLDAGRITACVQGELGAALMHRNAQLTDALDPPHQYVPWVVVNGKHTEELQAQAQSSLLRLVCQLYQVGMGWDGMG